MEKRRYLVVIMGVAIFVIFSHNATANIIVLWNGTQASIPSGWTCISCSIGSDPFTFLTTGVGTLYPRIGNSYCASDGETACGGSHTHTHTYNTVTTTPSTLTPTQPAPANGGNTASLSHTHTSLNVSTTLSNTSLPSSYPLVFIRANDNLEDTLPRGSIIFYNGTSAPTNFSMYTTADSYIIIAGTNDTRNIAIGQTVHNHSNHSLRTGNPSSLAVAVTGSKSSIATTTHTHTIGILGWLDNNDKHIPQFVDMPLIYATVETPIPRGAIVMANDTTRTGNYSKLNESNFLGKYIRANSTSFNTTGGYLSHNHSSQNDILSSGGSAAITRNAGADNYPVSTHTHYVNVSTSNSTNQPAYSNITLFLVNGSVAVAVSDTCTYVGSGNWNVNCADNCNITTTVNLLGNELNLTGTLGQFFYIAGRIFNWSEVKVKNCEVVIHKGGELG